MKKLVVGLSVLSTLLACTTGIAVWSAYDQFTALTNQQEAVVCFDREGKVTYGQDWKVCARTSVETPEMPELINWRTD